MFLAKFHCYASSSLVALYECDGYFSRVRSILCYFVFQGSLIRRGLFSVAVSHVVENSSQTGNVSAKFSRFPMDRVFVGLTICDRSFVVTYSLKFLFGRRLCRLLYHFFFEYLYASSRGTP